VGKVASTGLEPTNTNPCFAKPSTYNKRDFEGVEMFGIETIDPKIFLEKIGALP
jgi:hypothetical protein